jgi:spore germination cell wall hydrolase CwlJ-like protein
MAPPSIPQAQPVAAKSASRRVMVAALRPDSAALDAIDSMVPDQSIPMPETLSTKLAYAREDAPVTTFPKEPEYSSRELWCMATAIYFEARGESYRGQVAVAQVVMNRLKHPLYPKTICGVVFQGESKRNACQFSFACDGRPETVTDKKSWAQAQEIAEKVTTGELYLAEVGKATHYHASYVYPDWAPRLKRVTKIGLHIFYRFKHG